VTDDLAHLTRITTNAYAALLLAVEDDQIVGTLLGTYDGWRGTLYRMVVRSDKRRRGIGRDLVGRMHAIFAEWGVKKAQALVEVDRPWARQFWSAVGYPHDERIVRHVCSIERS
jgi:GNAT superfamily N-acetyltransferase